MKQGLVSVVLPVYNPDRGFLDMALHSICRQDYQPIELIVSDDSDVLAPEIEALLEHYGDKVELRYFKNRKGRGIFSNLNNAISHAQGEYVKIFSQDDLMKDGFITNQVKSLDLNEDVGMVFSAYEEINDTNQLINVGGKRIFNPGKSMLILPSEATGMFIRYGCFVGNISPVMVRRAMFDSIGFFNEDLKFASDFDFWIRMSRNSGLFYVHNAGLIVRTHPDRASHTLSNHQLLSDLKYIYGGLMDEIPEEHKRKALRQLHMRVGASFVHHAIREVVTLRWPFSVFKRRFLELNEYPFSALYSIGCYVISIPGRLLARLIK